MMKNNLFIKLLLILLFFSSCNNSKKELTKSIINSFAQAVKEEDEFTMKKTFPSIIYFNEYPKIDKIEIMDLDIHKDNVMALCTLYYETGLGKNIEQKIEFLVNPNDSNIIDVLGFLSRKKRIEMMNSGLFVTFPDLKPNEEEMDVAFAKNYMIAWNRINGYEYFAKKIITEKTKIDLDIKYNKTLKYGISKYSNVSISLSVKNNSEFECDYLYVDDNFDYEYILDGFKDIKESSHGFEGSFKLKPSELFIQSYSFKGEHYSPLNKDNIKITPEIFSTEEAIRIVKKYYDKDINEMILKGEKDYLEENNDFMLDSSLFSM